MLKPKSQVPDLPQTKDAVRGGTPDLLDVHEERPYLPGVQ